MTRGVLGQLGLETMNLQLIGTFAVVSQSENAQPFFTSSITFSSINYDCVIISDYFL